MKRSGPSHSKVRLFARLLGVPAYSAVGLLELLWHLAGRQAPDGAIGRFPDEEIAAGVEWDGDATALVRALVRSRLVDEDLGGQRLVVHDWPEHADDAVHAALAREHGFFADGTAPSLRKAAGREREALAEWYREHCAHGPKAACALCSEPEAPSVGGVSAEPAPGSAVPARLPLPLPLDSEQTVASPAAAATACVVAEPQEPEEPERRQRGKPPDPPPEYALRCAAMLREAVVRRWPHAQAPPAEPVAWAREIARVRQHPVTVEQGMQWLCDPKHDQNRYLPEVRSGRAFREKWDAIVGARKREKVAAKTQGPQGPAYQPFKRYDDEPPRRTGPVPVRLAVEQQRAERPSLWDRR